MVVIATIAGPQDERAIEWAAHWQSRGRLLLFVQARPEWMSGRLAKQIAEAAPGITIVPALPAGQCDLHWNSLIAVADAMRPEAVLTCKGTDEFMADEHWDALLKHVRGNPDIVVFWLAYKDFFDGHHFPEMQNGPDYHPVVLRGQPLRYGPNMHAWPHPACDVSSIGYLPAGIHMEHRRTIAGAVASNMARESHARHVDIQVQRQFLARLKQAAQTRGLAWPEDKEQA